MPSLEVVLGLLVAVTVLALLARRAHVPYPVLLVLGGLVLGLIPGLPAVKLAPDLVFLIFLPPLITAAGWYTSVRDLKANRRAIGLLSVGLVVFTTLGVGAAAHTLVPGLGWGPALVLGAIVSPTDAIAATAIMERSGAPNRIVAILEGESLLNDATGLVAFRYALTAVVAGTFTWWAAGLQFLYSVAAGIAIGLAVGWALIQVWRRIDDPLLGIILSILVPYATYSLADHLLASGVLAVAVSGIYAGRRSSEVISPAARIQAVAVWDLLVFVLNGLAFILIGLQLRQVVAGLGGESPWRLAVYGLAVSLAVIVVRFVWVFAGTYLPRLPKHVRERDPNPGWRNVVVVAWTGMRGVVSLAAALSVPLTISSGHPFPGRDLILFLTFCVILVTLVVQGLTLPLLLRRLGVTADGSDVREEAKARFRAVDAAISRLDELAGDEGPNGQVHTYVRAYYEKRRHTLGTRFGKLDHDHDGDGDAAEAAVSHAHADGSDHLEEHRARAESMQRLRQELIGIERATVIGLRNQGVINDAALRRVERDLDLEEIRLVES
jgi:CPA1 family monovalent cation:H+ antiporter